MEENRMYEYWKRQPEAMDDILEGRAELTAEFVRLYRDVCPDRLYLVGSGTSFNAESVAAPFMERILGVDVKVIPSSCIPEIRGERPMIVLISQGGSSTNTLAAMEQLADYPSIAITGERDCEIGRRSKHHMLIGCGEELAGPKTIGFTSSVMCFYVCALEAGLAAGSVAKERYDAVVRDLRNAVAYMPENIRNAEEWFERNADDLKEIRKYVVVGHDIAGIAATEGCLKILETIKVPAMSFEFEEYLHGPIILTDKGLGGLFFISEDPASKARMLELARCHEQFSPYSYPVTSDEGVTGSKVLHVRVTGNPATEVFEFVLSPQLLAAKIPGLLGLSDGSEAYDIYTSRCPTKYNNGR